MMAACRLMYAMFLDMVLPVFPVPFVSLAYQASHLQLTKGTGKTGNTISKNIAYIKRHAAIIPFPS